jgi:putative hydrolase of the HAD superfamily
MGGVMQEKDAYGSIDLANKELFEKTGVFLFPNNVRPSPQYKEFQTGKISSEEYFQNLINLSKAKISVKELMNAYKQHYLKATKFNPKMIKLVKDLRKKYAVACFSDTTEVHRQINEKKGFFKLFDFSFVSSGLGITKDEVRAFEIVIEKLKVKPNECVFIDDNEGHVERAKSIGIDAIHFQSYEQLISELKSRNII